MGKIKLTIDGKAVEVEAGKTVLEAARAAGIKIPTICAHEDLPNYGACRMCIVEIEGVRGYPTSCTTPAADGMVVKTQTPELQKQRNNILELMLSGHPNSCLVCPHREPCEKYRPRPTKAGRVTRCTFCSSRDSCELREMALSYPQGKLNLPTLYSNLKVEKYDPFMDRDYNLCILCGRCFRICEKIHGQPAIAVVSRGRWARIGTSFYKSHTESGCTFCGSCIDICPTGSLSDRYARWYGEPDEERASACTICPEGCSLWTQAEKEKCIATRMTAFTPEASLCAIGRFAYAQIVNAPDRLRRPMIKKGKELIGAGWDDAIEGTAAELKKYQGQGFAVIANQAETRENRYMYEQFATQVMNGQFGAVKAAGTIDDLKPESLKADLNAGTIKAAIVTGDFLTKDLIDKIECLVVIDAFPSLASASAFSVLPAAVLAEISGTYRNAAGEVKSLAAVSDPIGDSRPEWRIVRDLARAMGSDGFEFEDAGYITPKIANDERPEPMKGAPRENLKDLPTRFRGHYIADLVCALEELGLPMSPPEPEPEMIGDGFEVLEKNEVTPNFHLLTIKAPQVAEFAKPGQFVILMVKETSERAPFTLVDWDGQAGTITLIIEEVGRSSREVAELKAGDRIAHVTGPLGAPYEVKKLGAVALGGGCYGIGAIYPIARALKQAGTKVISVIEAGSDYLLYWEDKLRSVSDEVLVATKDGSKGALGGVQEVFRSLYDRGEKLDQLVAIGCTFMMRMVSEATRDLGIPIQVALNPIMVDGTGMCGACRVSVAGDTRFACVDGPMFNGHEVDWDELFARRGAYATLEVQALPQGAAREEALEKHGDHQCSGNCKR